METNGHQGNIHALDRAVNDARRGAADRLLWQLVRWTRELFKLLQTGTGEVFAAGAGVKRKRPAIDPRSIRALRNNISQNALCPFEQRNFLCPTQNSSDAVPCLLKKPPQFGGNPSASLRPVDAESRYGTPPMPEARTPTRTPSTRCVSGCEIHISKSSHHHSRHSRIYAP